MKPSNTNPVHNQKYGDQISNDISLHAPTNEKILNALLILSVRDPGAFDLIYSRYLTSSADWIAFIQYAAASPLRDGIGYHARQELIKFLASCDLNDISRREAVILTKVARPHSEQIPNLKPLFERIRIWDD